jgi:hypothetical protein
MVVWAMISASMGGSLTCAVRWLRERTYVLAMVVIVVILAVSGLAFYAMYRSKPSRLRLSARLLKLASFSIEVESQDGRQDGELPPIGDG